jgi:hypothetical protein
MFSCDQYSSRASICVDSDGNGITSIRKLSRQNIVLPKPEKVEFTLFEPTCEKTIHMYI